MSSLVSTYNLPQPQKNKKKSVNYLLDDDGLINIRSKEITVTFLNQEKISDQKNNMAIRKYRITIVVIRCLWF